MSAVFHEAGKAAWVHFLPLAVLENLNPPDRWRALIEDPAGVWVTEDEIGVAAFAVLRASGDEDARPSTAELDSFYAHPRVWGKGHARRLMAHSLAELKAMGFEEATLWTEERNHRPKAFYKSCGWSPDGTLRRRSLQGIPIVEARWRLYLTPNA